MILQHANGNFSLIPDSTIILAHIKPTGDKAVLTVISILDGVRNKTEMDLETPESIERAKKQLQIYDLINKGVSLQDACEAQQDNPS